jgi:hypothetical protein
LPTGERTIQTVPLWPSGEIAEQPVSRPEGRSVRTRKRVVDQLHAAYGYQLRSSTASASASWPCGAERAHTRYVLPGSPGGDPYRGRTAGPDAVPDGHPRTELPVRDFVDRPLRGIGYGCETSAERASLFGRGEARSHETARLRRSAPGYPLRMIDWSTCTVEVKLPQRKKNSSRGCLGRIH